MNSSNNIIISIVMPVYNGRKYLREAIDSILCQTFADFEFIIINDGSTDDTAKIIDSYQDKRIVRINNEKNLGLSKSFNIGIRTAQGQFIARMDADDISVPDRLERQLFFLQDHKDVDIVGSYAILMDEYGKPLKIIRKPGNHQDIKWQSLFSTPLIHPTVFAKANVLKNNPYNENMANSEDYELWSRLLFTTNTHFSNMQESLLLYRQAGFTQQLDSERRKTSAENSIRNIEKYTAMTDYEKELIIAMRQDKKIPFNKLLTVFHIYKRALKSFIIKEGLGAFNLGWIYSKLANLYLSLFKYKLKHL